MKKQADSRAVVILEDDPVCSRLIVRAIKSTVLQVQPFPSFSIEHAKALLENIPAKLLISDISLPDGNGMDFAEEILHEHSEIKVIFITSGDISQYEERSKKIGSIEFLSKPLKLAILCQIVKKTLGPLPSSSSHSPTENFRATLSKLTPIDIIQLKCMAGVSQGLRFTQSNGDSGIIHLQQGQIIHAQTNTESGPSAFKEIMRWRSGEIFEEEVDASIPTTFPSKSWEEILLNSVYLIDEEKEQAKDTPTPEKL